MGAHKHHNLVWIHTPQCPLINTNPHNLPTKLSPHNATTRYLPTKLPLLHFNANKISTKVPPTKISLSPTNSQSTTPYNPLFKPPLRSTSKIGKHSNAAATTHTTQHHTHKGKQNHFYSTNNHSYQKKPKDKQQTIYKLTSKKTPSPLHASPHKTSPTIPLSETH